MDVFKELSGPVLAVVAILYIVFGFLKERKNGHIDETNKRLDYIIRLMQDRK